MSSLANPRVSEARDHRVGPHRMSVAQGDVDCPKKAAYINGLLGQRHTVRWIDSQNEFRERSFRTTEEAENFLNDVVLGMPKE